VHILCYRLVSHPQRDRKQVSTTFISQARVHSRVVLRLVARGSTTDAISPGRPVGRACRASALAFVVPVQPARGAPGSCHLAQNSSSSLHGNFQTRGSASEHAPEQQAAVSRDDSGGRLENIEVLRRSSEPVPALSRTEASAAPNGPCT